MKVLKLTRRELVLIRESLSLHSSYFLYNFFIAQFLNVPDVAKKKREIKNLLSKFDEIFENIDFRTKIYALEEFLDETEEEEDF